MARNGKIARLPETVRDELNRRIRGGELGPQILPWLNSLPETKTVCAEHFAGQEINPQNLSDWRNGGYKEWEEHCESTHRIREWADWAVKLTEANGGRIAEGASAIAAGKVLELLSETDGAMDLEKLGDVITGLTSLRSSEIAQQRANTDREKLRQKDEELALAREKFMRETCELFIKWCDNKQALEAATSTGDNTAKIQRLGQLMFGDDWKP